MLIPPPETVTTSVNHTPEGMIAIMTLLLIGCLVYGLSKIKFTYFIGVLVSTYQFIMRRHTQSDASLNASTQTSHQ